MGDRIRLHVKGLTYSERPTGAYALLLESGTDKRKLPIVIGAFEAQSIAIALDKMTRPPRPMTHDLFASVMDAHDVKLKEVVIQDLQDGVFYAVLVFERNGEDRTMDARPSDAIALALRADCPIYASSSVMGKASLAESEAKTAVLQEVLEEPDELPDGDPLESREAQQALSKANSNTLNEWLERALEQEDYELAARIRDELTKRL